MIKKVLLISICTVLFGMQGALASTMNFTGFLGEPGLAYESGGEITQNLLASGEPFTSLFAQNDRMAVGAIRAIRDAGLRVPQDISVIGYDDIPLTSYFDPPLTTIHQPIDDFGRYGAQLLISAVKNEKHKRKQVRLDAQIVKRDSCATLNL